MTRATSCATTTSSPAEQARVLDARGQAQDHAVRREAAGRSPHGGRALRQADPAHAGVLRLGHRRARRVPDDHRRVAGADRRARVGLRHRSRARSPGLADRLAHPRAGAPRGDGRARRRTRRQRAHRRVPPLPGPRRPAHRSRSTAASWPGRRSPSSATPPATWGTATCSPARRPGCTCAVSGPEAYRPDEAVLGRAQEIAAAHRWLRGVRRGPGRGRHRRRRRRHRHLGVDGP